MNLKKTIAFWDHVMTSITFAEANEHDTALQILKSEQARGLSKDEALPGRTGRVALEDKKR